MKAESVRKAILSSVSLSVLGKLLSFGSSLLIAYYFGANNATDFLFLMGAMAVLASSIIMSCHGMLPSIILEIKTKYSEKEAWKFIFSFVTFELILLMGILLLYFLSPSNAVSLFSKFDQEQIHNNYALVVIFAIIFFITVLNDLFKTIINSFGQFTIPSLIGLFQSIIMVAFIVMLHEKFYVSSMAFALLFSGVIQTLFMLWYISKNGFKVKLRRPYHFYFPPFFKAVFPVVTAQVFSSFATYFYSYQASGLKKGVLTALYYGEKLFLLPETLVFLPIANVLRTKFSLLAATDLKQIKVEFVRFAASISFLSIPLSLYLFLYSYDIMILLFARGKFTLEDARIASHVLKVYAPGIFVMSIVYLNSQVFLSLRKMGRVSYIGVVTSLISVWLTSVLVETQGYIGIPLTRITMLFVFSLPIQLYFVDKFLNKIQLRSLFKQFFQILLLSLISFFSVNMLMNSVFVVEFSSKTEIGVRLVLATGLSIVIYVYLTTLFRLGTVMELRNAYSLAKNKIKLRVRGLPK